MRVRRPYARGVVDLVIAIHAPDMLAIVGDADVLELAVAMVPSAPRTVAVVDVVVSVTTHDMLTALSRYVDLF